MRIPVWLCNRVVLFLLSVHQQSSDQYDQVVSSVGCLECGSTALLTSFWLSINLYYSQLVTCILQQCGVRARICPLPYNSKEDEDLSDVKVHHVTFDLAKIISLRILQIIYSSRRTIPHPWRYTCHQWQCAQQGSGHQPSSCVSLISFSVHLLYLMCWFSLSYVLDIVFTKLWSCSWNSYNILGKLYLVGGRESPLLKII